jgi:GAG-pre-integrase domain
MSDGRRLRLSQVLYVPRLSINLLSVSHLTKKGIMTSFTKTGCALIDSDDGNCLLAEAIITPGGLYIISKAVRRASLAALSLSATAVSSPSKGLAPLSKNMQMPWHARLGHVGFETVRRAAHTGATTGIDLTAHTKNCNCHTCLLQKASRRPFKGSIVKRASIIGDVIHTDLASRMPPTINGYKYVDSFINGRTSLKYIYLLNRTPMPAVRCVISSSSSSASTTASSSPRMLTTWQSLLVVILTAASASRASSLPALRRIHWNP